MNIESNQLRNLMQSETWDILMRRLAKTIDQIQNMNVIGSNEFETLKLTFTREAKIQALKDFFNELETDL